MNLGVKGLVEEPIIFGSQNHLLFRAYYSMNLGEIVTAEPILPATGYTNRTSYMSQPSDPSDTTLQTYSDLKVGTCFVWDHNEFRVRYFYRKMDEKYAYNFTTNKISKFKGQTIINPVRLQLKYANDE